MKQTKNSRYLVNFGYAMLHKDIQGELPQLLMTKEEVKHWLCILNPLKATEWFENLCMLNRKEKMFLKVLEKDVIKIVKIQRN